MNSVTIPPEHTPQRPGWQCAVCGADWPCAPAKVALAEQHVNDKTALTIYLALRYWEAIDDALDPGGIKIITHLRERFVGWTDVLNANGENHA